VAAIGQELRPSVARLSRIEMGDRTGLAPGAGNTHERTVIRWPEHDFIGPFRLLRVLVDLTRSEAETIGSIGHELWHAIEVLSDPSIDSNAAIVFFFKQFTESNRFETAAATKVGVAVYEEVRAAHDRDRRHPPSRD
jgi:hypothetical protein